MTPLRIVSASEPMHVETIVLTLYGTPGVGKSSLGFSARDPLLLDCDRGAYRSEFRKDVAAADSWADIAGITAKDVEPYKTLVLDTAGRALDLLSLDIIAQNPKMGRGGALTLQGYGQLKSRFTDYLRLMRSFGLDIVLIAHSDEKQSGDDIIERIDMQGGSKQEVYKSSDAMARLGILNGQRVLSFSPTETQFGKDPAALGRVEVPDLSVEPDFLGNLIDGIKLRLNAVTEQQKAAQDAHAEFVATVEATEDPEALTGLIQAANGDRRKKLVIMDYATSMGWEYDKEAHGFVAP